MEIDGDVIRAAAVAEVAADRAVADESNGPAFRIGQVVYVREDCVYDMIGNIEFEETPSGRVYWYSMMGELGVTHPGSDMRALNVREIG